MPGNVSDKGTIKLRAPKPRTNGRDVGNVIKLSGDSQFPKEFISIGRDFEEALGRTVLIDRNERIDVVIYEAHLEEFLPVSEPKIRMLTNFLNGAPSEGGYNRIQALMAHIMIMSEKAAGVKLRPGGSEDTLKKLHGKREEGNQGDQHEA